MRLSYVARSLLFAWALDVCSSECMPGANFEVGVLRATVLCAAGLGWGFGGLRDGSLWEAVRAGAYCEKRVARGELCDVV